ncbi:MAG TPA: Holliday junction branch migration DNA helicase RuvB [Planctomycetota bacterium]|nr:Holliday junction branch migration DNA helicase RuvB [Planctomycetota bacterium]
MTRERIVTGASLSPDEETFNWTLRPKRLCDLIGQKAMVQRLQIALQAAAQRKEPLEHVLLYGPPGLGKTTLAHIIAAETGSRLVQTSGPALSRPGDLMGILTNLEERDVLFIDEVHRLPTVVEEFMYPAMEDFCIDFTLDKGAFAKPINFALKRFTLVGATTRAGLLTNPLRERFGIFHHLDFYPPDEIAQILERSAKVLGVKAEHDALDEVAKCSRGTPRIANRLLKRVRDYAQMLGDGSINKDCAVKALAMEGIDRQGLDILDRKYLTTLIKQYNGGPAGVEAIAAGLSEETDTLVDMVEPYLLKVGFISRTNKGRVANGPAYSHLMLTPPKRQPQHGLF